MGVSVRGFSIEDWLILMLLIYYSWVLISDFAAQGYLVDGRAGASLWPHLLFQYSLSGAQNSLPMVQGDFVNE